MPHVVMTGNPVTGYVLYGPFPDNASANTWGENNLENQHWWTVPITPPVSK